MYQCVVRESRSLQKQGCVVCGEGQAAQRRDMKLRRGK